MTNVPNEIREMWADVYKLFDMNYLMPNTEEAWGNFWEQALKLYDKYNRSKNIISLVIGVTDIIDNRMKQELHDAEKGK